MRLKTVVKIIVIFWPLIKNTVQNPWGCTSKNKNCNFAIYKNLEFYNASFWRPSLSFLAISQTVYWSVDVTRVK